MVLIETFDVDLIINTGVSGGLDPSLDIFDIVVPTSNIQHDYDLTPTGEERGYIPGSGKVFMPDMELSELLYACAEQHAYL